MEQSERKCQYAMLVFWTRHEVNEESRSRAEGFILMDEMNLCFHMFVTCQVVNCSSAYWTITSNARILDVFVLVTAIIRVMQSHTVAYEVPPRCISGDIITNSVDS